MLRSASSQILRIKPDAEQGATTMENTAITEFNAATENHAFELATTGAAAKEQHEIQSAITIAKRFPRNEEGCFQKLMKAASRASFAEDATYSFPRGDQDVTGPSVNLAREAARIWGNVRYGLSVVRDDDRSRLIRGWAWDVETNTKVEVEDDFQKLIQRKGKGWIVPDERDLRELTNRRGAILLRNAILQVLPKDLIEDALFACSESLSRAAGENPDGAKKRLLVDFGGLNITVEQIEMILGHPFSQSTPKEIAQLRGVCKSIQDGNTTWAEYVKGADAVSMHPESGKTKAASVLDKMRAAPSQPPPAPSVDLDAAWLSEVVDCEDCLRGTQQSKGTLRSIRAGFKLADGGYPLLPEERQQYKDLLIHAVKRMQAN